MTKQIQAYFNSDLIDENGINNFGIEIGISGVDFEAFENIVEYEFYPSYEEAIKRVDEINSLSTNNWSLI